MKNKFILLSLALILPLIIIGNASAGVGYKEYSILNPNSNISRIYGFMQYGSTFNSFPTSLCFFNYCYIAFIDQSDFVPFGTTFQAYILYGLEPISQWNQENENVTNATIDYCTINITETHNVTKSLIFNRTFTETDIAVTPNQFKEFVSLQRGDYVEVTFDCHYIDSNTTILSPASFSFVAPTLNCQACQYYDNFKQSSDDFIADAITDFTDNIKNNMIIFLTLNWQLFITAFKIGRIIVLIFAVGLVFYILLAFYLFIKSLRENT